MGQVFTGKVEPVPGEGIESGYATPGGILGE
jgi:hypothetical protein